MSLSFAIMSAASDLAPGQSTTLSDDTGLSFTITAGVGSDPNTVVGNNDQSTQVLNDLYGGDDK